METGSGDTLDKLSADYPDRITTATGRMQVPVSSPLVYSRLGQGTQVFERVDLTEIATRALSDFGVRVDEIDARIQIEEMGHIDDDAGWLYRLMLNLLSNSQMPLFERFSVVSVYGHEAIDEEGVSSGSTATPKTLEPESAWRFVTA